MSYTFRSIIEGFQVGDRTPRYIAILEGDNGYVELDIGGSTLCYNVTSALAMIRFEPSAARKLAYAILQATE
jgi:hypothetical protein